MISGIKDIVGRLTGAKDAQELMQKSLELQKANDERELHALRNIEDILTTINENVFTLTKHFKGYATSLETIQSVLTARQAEEEFAKNSTSPASEIKDIPKKSAIESFFERLNNYLSLISAVLLPLLGGFVLGFKKLVDEKFGEFWGNVYVAFAALLAFSARFRKLVFGSVAAIFKVIGAIFSGDLLTNLRVSVGKWIGELFEKIGKAGRWLGELTGSVGSYLDDIVKWFGKFAAVLKVAPKLLKGIPVIGQVIAVVMGIFDGVKGAIEGFKEGGVLGAVRGAIAGVVSGLVGWIGDLASWLVGSLIELLGFDQLGASIKKFDFTGWLNDAIKSLFDTLVTLITTPIEFVKGLVKHVTDVFAAFKEFFDGLGNGDGILDSFIGLGEKIYKSLVDFLTKMTFHMTSGLPVVGKTAASAINRARTQVGLPALSVGSTTAEMSTEQRSAGQAAAIEKYQSAIQAKLQSDSELNDRFQEARTENDRKEMHEILKEMGITDKVERDHYIDSLYRDTRVEVQRIAAANVTSAALAPVNVAATVPRTTSLSKQAAASRAELATVQSISTRYPTAISVSAPSSTITNVQNNNQNLYSSSAALTTEFPVALA